jgi:hypothetical protein
LVTDFNTNVNKFVEIHAHATLSVTLVRGSTQCTEASALRFNFETAMIWFA